MRLLPSFQHLRPSQRARLALLQWTWSLPNALVSALALFVAQGLLGGHAIPYRGAVVVRLRALRGVGGVCLGHAILVPDNCSERLIRHEWGHFQQSLILGPLYYLVIGVPSFVHAIWHTARRGSAASYYQFYTEAWAEQLAGLHAPPVMATESWARFLGRPLSDLSESESDGSGDLPQA